MEDLLGEFAGRWPLTVSTIATATASIATDFHSILPSIMPPLSPNNIVYLYAVKHNPFAYFKSVQKDAQPGSSLANMVAFERPTGLYADLADGKAPRSRV